MSVTDAGLFKKLKIGHLSDSLPTYLTLITAMPVGQSQLKPTPAGKRQV
ncbi:MAG: hypothetical protein KAI39_08390 [Desulfobulbaceae bacterium]|nr:hypothetical protein [Desulfobulbaceae bacterium]